MMIVQPGNRDAIKKTIQQSSQLMIVHQIVDVEVKYDRSTQQSVKKVQQRSHDDVSSSKQGMFRTSSQ